MTEIEQNLAANLLGRIGDILAGRVPERVVKAHARLVTLLNLPSYKRRSPPCASERLSEDELQILVEWLDAAIEIYNGHTSAPAIDAHLKLDRLL
jgi:hypothetical protein